MWAEPEKRRFRTKAAVEDERIRNKLKFKKSRTGCGAEPGQQRASGCSEPLRKMFLEGARACRFNGEEATDRDADTSTDRREISAVGELRCSSAVTYLTAENKQQLCQRDGRDGAGPGRNASDSELTAIRGQGSHAS